MRVQIVFCSLCHGQGEKAERKSSFLCCSVILEWTSWMFFLDLKIICTGQKKIIMAVSCITFCNSVSCSILAVMAGKNI